jgi:hypothetical protein
VVVTQAVEGKITAEESADVAVRSGVDTSAEIAVSDDMTAEDKITKMLQSVLPTMEKEAVDYVVSVAIRLHREKQSSIAGTAAEADGGSSVTIRDWMLIEMGKTTWQKRWFVLASGRLDMYFSPEATSEDERICRIPLKVIRIVEQPKTVRPEAPFAFRISVVDATK